MVHRPTSIQEETVRKGPWAEEEDDKLAMFVTLMGERRWDSIAKTSGLRRSGKSCRLRWMNYLRPDLKHGQISSEEELIILQLHEHWGNKWSRIARRLPGRTDNEIKNYWRTHLRKRAQGQEQEKVQKEIEMAMSSKPENISRQESNLSSQTSSFDGSSWEETWTTSKEELIDPFGSLDYAFSMSPYENRLSEWISGEPSNPSSSKQHEEYNILDSWVRNPTQDFDGVWGNFSGSLWNWENQIER